MLKNLHPTDLAQGTIISCCIGSEYQHCPVFGLVITARCDAAHSKVPIYNYLPLVGLRDWLQKHGADIVAERVVANCRGTMEQCLSQKQMALDLLDLIETEKIALELAKDKSKNGAKVAERFRQAAKDKETAHTIFGKSTPKERGLLLSSNQKMTEAVLKELIRNQISDFHYIPKISTNEEPSGYVVNLREVRHISANVAELVLDGLDPEEYLSESDLSNTIRTELNFNHIDHTYALPISQIGSPQIELILQRFSNLFARIGVDDLTVDEIEHSSNTLNQILESAE